MFTKQGGWTRVFAKRSRSSPLCTVSTGSEKALVATLPGMKLERQNPGMSPGFLKKRNANDSADCYLRESRAAFT